MRKVITKRTALKYVKEIEGMLLDKTNMGSKGVREFLTKKGLVFTQIGTGKQSYICSKMVSIMTLKNTYIKGQYLCVGCANIGVRNGVIYQAYVIEVR